ncbi:hypothetical protein DUNSADRAFT_12832 [Dunaliella salina]|uniref:Encoded protein n=1 Tax=Dunaliella salina TaxID=3046 RepID=A0ABQ7H9S5_DUNSA|nr:hypothetical protein DUNSADRAFT_12832 [Dunaliella salina]|eukprot:KAF5843570.1 hypothetical protein DUNSADRAFT_12832 [Dunaliella salina]
MLLHGMKHLSCLTAGLSPSRWASSGMASLRSVCAPRVQKVSTLHVSYPPRPVAQYASHSCPPAEACKASLTSSTLHHPPPAPAASLKSPSNHRRLARGMVQKNLKKFCGTSKQRSKPGSNSLHKSDKRKDEDVSFEDLSRKVC